MGIVNITPDSFSDGGELADDASAEARVAELVADGAELIDLGAESTRPGATPLTAEQEWARLEPVLGRLVDRYRGHAAAAATQHRHVSRRHGAPRVAARRRHHQRRQRTDDARDARARCDKRSRIRRDAQPRRAGRQGAHAARGSGSDGCRRAMARAAHRPNGSAQGSISRASCSIPASASARTRCSRCGLLRNVARFQRFGLRLLVGHSRKSFMHQVAAADREDRDLFTVGASLNLCRAGVDILRVHNVAAHAAAYRGWAHVE